jgi:hypothetical protein
MGYLKNKAAEEADQAEAAWARKADYEDYRCKDCGELISYADREVFFQTKLCAYHAAARDR